MRYDVKSFKFISDIGKGVARGGKGDNSPKPKKLL